MSMSTHRWIWEYGRADAKHSRAAQASARDKTSRCIVSSLTGELTGELDRTWPRSFAKGTCWVFMTKRTAYSQMHLVHVFKLLMHGADTASLRADGMHLANSAAVRLTLYATQPAGLSSAQRMNASHPYKGTLDKISIAAYCISQP